MNLEQAIEWAETWEKVPSETPSGDEQALIVLARTVRKQRECLLWLRDRHHGGLMRAKIDEALTANAELTRLAACGQSGGAKRNES